MTKIYFFTIFFILLNSQLASVEASPLSSIGVEEAFASVERDPYLSPGYFVPYSSSQDVISQILSAYLYEVYLMKKKQIRSQYSDIKNLVDLNIKRQQVNKRSDNILKMEQQGSEYVDKTTAIIEQAVAYDEKMKKMYMYIKTLNLQQKIKEQKREMLQLIKETMDYELETNAFIRDYNRSLYINCETTECVNEKALTEQKIKDKKQFIAQKAKEISSIIKDTNQKTIYYNKLVKNYKKAMEEGALEIDKHIAELENNIKEPNILSLDSFPLSYEKTEPQVALLEIKELILNAEYEWINSFLFSAYPQREGKPTGQEQQNKFQSLREKFLSNVSEDMKDLHPSFIETYELVSAVGSQLEQNTYFPSSSEQNKTSSLSEALSVKAMWDYRLPLEGRTKKCFILRWMRTGEISRFLSEKEPVLPAVKSEYFSNLFSSEESLSETPDSLLLENTGFCPLPETFMEALFFNSFYHLVSFYKVKEQQSIYYEMHVNSLFSTTDSKKSPLLSSEVTSNPSRFFVIGPKGGVKERDSMSQYQWNRID